MTKGDARFRSQIVLVAFVAILLLGLSLRRYTFDLPHIRGDQQHYVALALKLVTEGMPGYNLRGIDRRTAPDHPQLKWLRVVEGRGPLLDHLARQGIAYYDEPLHHVPYLLPVALVLSHALVTDDDRYFILTIPEAPSEIARAGPGVGLRDHRFDPAIAAAQHYAVLVPLAASLALLAGVYFLGAALFERRSIGLLAMFAIAVSPIDILASQRVWADDLTAALATWAVLLYVLADERGSAGLALAAGALCGLAAVAKQNGAFVAIALGLWHLVANFEGTGPGQLRKLVLEPRLWLFAAAAALVSAHWFGSVFLTYGSPIYQPDPIGIEQTDATGWYAAVRARPVGLYLLGAPFQNPLFALAYAAPLRLRAGLARARGTLLLLVWLAVYLVIFEIVLGSGGREHRYLLPAYPAFALLGASVAVRAQVWLDARSRLRPGSVLVAVLVAGSALWSVPLGLDAVFFDRSIIAVPF